MWCVSGQIVSAVPQLTRKQDKIKEKWNLQEEKLASVKEPTDSYVTCLHTDDNKIVENQETQKHLNPEKLCWAIGCCPADCSLNSICRKKR